MMKIKRQDMYKGRFLSDCIGTPKGITHWKIDYYGEVF